VLLHVAAAYQVFSMNVYQVIEEKVTDVSRQACAASALSCSLSTVVQR
jgi:hypothetical protein